MLQNLQLHSESGLNEKFAVIITPNHRSTHQTEDHLGFVFHKAGGYSCWLVSICPFGLIQMPKKLKRTPFIGTERNILKKIFQLQEINASSHSCFRFVGPFGLS